MKISASESESLQSCKSRREERLSRSKSNKPFLIDWDAKLFMY